MTRWLALVLGLASGCVPALEGDPALVDGPRVVAIRADPAEAAPGESVTLTALVVGGDGTEALAWALCDRAPEVAGSSPVAPECQRERAPHLTPITTAVGPVSTVVPADACAVFGPTPAPAGPGEPPRRPVDPDLTGGYHQPVRASLGGALAFGRIRLRCGLAGVTAETSRAFRDGYAPNAHPEVELDLPGAAAPGETVRVRAAWDGAAAEPYLLYDREARALVERTEVLTLAWFVEGGRLEGDRWTLPTAPGAARVWVVLRDDRGGVGWASGAVDVR